MKFIGADLHKKIITFWVVEEVSNRNLKQLKMIRLSCSQPDEISKFLRQQGPCQVAVEATLGFDWFAALAEQVCRRVVIAHPGKLRVIAESTRKTDKIDRLTQLSIDEGCRADCAACASPVRRRRTRREYPSWR